MRNFATNSTNDDLFAVAKNNAIPLGTGTSTADKMLVYLTVEPKVISAAALGTVIGGCSNPNTSVQPAYYPFATLGSECAAIVTSLDWADNNLATGYEYLQVYNVNTAYKYFVSGVLTSSKTDFNDPFDAVKSGTQFTKGCCWNGDFMVGINPF